MSNIKEFTAAQMDVINAMLAAAITEAVATTVAAMSAAPAAAPAPPAARPTMAQAKACSITERIHHGAIKASNIINDVAGATGNYAADKLSTFEVNAVPAVVKATGIICAKSAFTAVSIGNTLSCFADRCAAARLRMEFAK